MDGMNHIERNIITDISERIERLITDARTHIVRTVNITEVITKYEIGRIIVASEGNLINGFEARRKQ